MNRTQNWLLLLVLAVGLPGCDTSSTSLPTRPSLANSPPPPSTPRPPQRFMADVTLSGIVYEMTPAGPVPVEGVDVYCEPCGEATHSWASTDSNGFYRFVGVWDDNGFPIRLWSGKEGYADPPGLPTPTPPNPSGPGWREVEVNGDTRFDIELVRQ